MTQKIRRRGLVAALTGGPLLLWDARSADAAGAVDAADAGSSSGSSSAPKGSPGIPKGFEAVDPRTARRVPLWQELSPTNPVFEGDPAFTYTIATTIPESGYLLEMITSLGTHTGTHISAPAHFVADGAPLSELDESWTLMPLVILDVRARVTASGGGFSLSVTDLTQFERRFGRIPAGACVLVFSGLSGHYTQATGPGRADDYFDPAPGLTAPAVAWLFDQRGVKAVGSDTFGPDASSDTAFGATATALAKGGITVENVGPGLARMRPYGDWVSINGARPCFSGFQMGITGFTVR
jgi:kynurenine formamidase